MEDKTINLLDFLTDSKVVSTTEDEAAKKAAEEAASQEAKKLADQKLAEEAEAKRKEEEAKAAGSQPPGDPGKIGAVEDDELVKSIFANSGFKPSEKTYQLTVESMAEAIKDSAEYGKERFLKTLKETNPLGYDILMYAESGGNPYELLMLPTDYSSIVFQEDNEQMHEDIIINYYSTRGIGNDIILKTISEYKDKNILKSKSKELLDIEVKEEAKQKETLIQNQNKLKAKLEAEKKEVAERFKTAIDKGEVKSDNITLVIPEKDRGDLANRIMSNVLQDPNSGKFYMYSEVDVNKIDELILHEYFRSKGGNLKDLLIRVNNTNNVSSLKDKFKQANEQKGGNSGNPGGATTPFNIQQILTAGFTK